VKYSYSELIRTKAEFAAELFVAVDCQTIFHQIMFRDVGAGQADGQTYGR
jgi:hypothetical protein